MEREVSWLTFGVAGTLTRSVVHFFPSAGTISAPYAAHCRLTLFASGAPIKSVVVDTVRISNPDGLWVDDAFPTLRERSGLFGLRIDMTTPQPRVDLSHSECIIEFHSPLHLSRFWPIRLSADGSVQPNGPLPLIKDSFNETSLIVVNGSGVPFTPSLVVARSREGGDVRAEGYSVSVVAPYSVVEVPIAADFYGEVPPQETSYGLLRSASIAASEPLTSEIGLAIMYRDAANGQPTSVCSL